MTWTAEISRKSEKERKKVSAMGVRLVSGRGVVRNGGVDGHLKDVNHTHFIFADDGSFAKVRLTLRERRSLIVPLLVRQGDPAEG